MKRIIISVLSVFLLFSATIAQTVVPLTRKGEVYSFDSRLNGKQVSTIISSYSRNFIPLDLVLSMYADSLLIDADFLGFQDNRFVPERIVPGVLVNLREVVIGGKTVKNVQAFITGNLTPFFALGQIELNKLGPLSFSDGTMMLDDKSIIVVSNRTPETVPDTCTTEAKPDSVTPHGKTLADYLEAAKALSGKTAEYKASLYKEIALSYKNLGNLKEMENYLKKAAAISDGKDRMDLQALLIEYYKSAGSVQDYEKATLQYLKEYCALNKIKLSDCWTAGKADAIIANHLLGLGKCFEQRDDFRKFYTYYYYSAAWGNESAQEFCQNVSMEYWKEPLNELSF